LSADAPTRTVTLLFSDIEESTRLLREAGDDYAAILAEYRRVLRDAFARHGGREVDTQGDSFFVVFDSARDAVQAAVEAQRTLAGPDWPFGQPVRVRIGIETGEPSVGDDGYIGLVVHRAARICAAAHGGQVLLSSATRGVLGEDEVAGTALLDLGSHLLKDFYRAEQLYQLLIDGLPADLRAPRTGVPDDAVPVGREEPDAGLVEAVEAAIEPPVSRAGAPAGVAPDLPKSVRQAGLATVRSPAYLVLLAALVAVGVVVTPWVFALAVALTIVIVALSTASRRRESVLSVGWRVSALEAVAPDHELASLLRDLGFGLSSSKEWAWRAEKYLAENNRRTISREVRRRRAAAASAGDALQADRLARELDALDAVAERRAATVRELRRFGSCVDELRDALFESRLGHAEKDELVAQLEAERAKIDGLLTGLRDELATARDRAALNTGFRRVPLGGRFRRYLRRRVSLT
jgi:class 3 adenylate cyclase